MKKIIFAAFLAASGISFGQMLEGPLLDEGRKVISPVKYVHEGSTNGWGKFELSVDREGNVESVRMVETTIKSTPTKIKLRNYLMKLKFEKGTYYPKYHHVTVKLTSVIPN